MTYHVSRWTLSHGLHAYLCDCPNYRTCITLHRFNLVDQLFSPFGAVVDLRNKFILDVLSSRWKGLHRILAQKTLNARLWDQPVQSTGKEKLLPHIRQDRVALHGEHLRKRRKCIRVQSAQRVTYTHFHRDSHHGSGQHGRKESRKLID